MPSRDPTATRDKAVEAMPTIGISLDDLVTAVWPGRERGLPPGLYSRALTLFPHAGFHAIPAPLAALESAVYFKVSGQSRCFDGHFDGAPILPGVAHVALALSACAKQAGRSRTVKGLRDLRLKRPLRPGDEVEVVLTNGPDAASVRFEIRHLGESVTVGTLVFEPAQDGSHG
jgi:hypothetical protein